MVVHNSKIQDSTQLKAKGQLSQYPGPHEFVFYGETNSTTKTELFLNGEANQRLELPTNSVAVINKVCLGYNETDGAAATSTPEIASGNVASTLGTSTTVTQAGTHVICDIEADDTNDWLTVSVTAADATDVIAWKVHLTVMIIVDPVIDGVTRVYGT